MKGETVQLVVKTQTGTDGWGAPIYTEELVEVEDVLIGQPTSDDIKTTLDKKDKITISKYTISAIASSVPTS